jgi:hypothetical protein
MSKEPTFKNYFSYVERILNKQALHVFDINSFMLESHDRNTFLDLCKDNKQSNRCIVYKHSFVTDLNRNISDSTDISPILIYDNSKSSPTGLDIGKKIDYRIFKSIHEFFADTSVKLDPKQARCVFANALNAIHILSKQSEFLLQMTELYMDSCKRNRLTLKVYADCFEKEINQFFRLNEPKPEFEAMVRYLLERVNSCLKPKDIDHFEKLNLNKQPDLEAFIAILSLLEQNKLSPSRQEHLQQVVKSMNICIDSCIKEVVGYLERFCVWINNIKDHISNSESFINELQFALQELNNRIVNEIIAISK